MLDLKTLPACAFFLFAAIVLYAVAGSPTPDNPGMVEAVLGFFLILAVGTSLRGGIDLRLSRNFFLKSLQVLFLCGLILPTLSGVYFGNDTGLILRDILAFSFLGLPLFLSEKLGQDERTTKILCGLLIFCGLAFALRTLIPAFNIWIPQGELLYLSNSPLALFAAVFSAGCVWKGLEDLTRPALIRAAGGLAALALLLAAMLLDVQRATIGAVILTFIILSLFSLIRSPRKALVPLAALIILGAVIYPLLHDTLQVMAQKTSMVGLNMRTQEALAVFNALSAVPETFFIGRGWGSVFSSPAVGGLDANYTHSLLTTMALKGGMILFAFSLLMVLAALYQIFLIFQRDRVQGLALFWPLIIPVFLYASHKSLDFGLLLLMIGVWSVQGQTLHHTSPSVKTKEHL